MGPSTTIGMIVSPSLKRGFQISDTGSLSYKISEEYDKGESPLLSD